MPCASVGFALGNLNAVIAWLGIVLGVVSGTLIGLRFGREEWMGGYASWPRRMVRLGHISFFGVGLLNLAYALTVGPLHWRGSAAMSVSLASANAMMPAVCFLSAWKTPMRAFFFVPVGLILFPAAGVLWMRFMP
jgi:hypothetical protein